MRWILVSFGVVVGIFGFWNWYRNSKATFVSPLGTITIKQKPLNQYRFETLAEYVPQASQIKVNRLIEETEKFHAMEFEFVTENKRMTGQLNVPNEATPAAGFPIILMLRGYVDREIYTTGVGTKNAAAVLAQNGWVTIAPDFLGYGGSEMPPNDTMEERLQKPKQILDLIASVRTLSFVNVQKLGMWGHSNGGQLALSVLEISGRDIPTTLWAPVSKPFPFSILYYTDEAPDQGKALRKTVADFEQDYDVFDFSVDRYWDRIAAPMQIHQGGRDEAVPKIWTDTLVQELTKREKVIEYFVYPFADHNLKPDWNTVVGRDVEFFRLAFLEKEE